MLNRRAAAGLPDAVLQAASVWFVRLGAEDAGADDRRQWQEWLRSDPLHQQAWERVEALGREFGHIEPRAGLTALDRPRSAGRRKLLKTLSLAFVAGGGALAAQELPWDAWGANVRTATGERRRLELADGSILTMNTDSAVDLAFDGAKRELILRRGEIHIETRPDPLRPARPFLVSTPVGRATALGTRFDVDLMGDHAQVAVEQGAVRLEPRLATHASVVVPAGMAATFDAGSATAPTAFPPQQQGWVDGMLYANGMRLDALVAALARYRPGRLACDPAVGSLRISGAYPVDDTDRALAAIGRVLPVRADRLTRYWVTVRAR